MAILSLIIPTYNRPDDLKICLNSVINAIRKPDEIIIVDDGGNFDLTDIVKEILTDKVNFKIIKNQNNLGVSICRNIGIANAKGDIIFFLDDDCEVLPDYFQEIEKIYIDDAEQKIGGVEGMIISKNQDAISKTDIISKIFFLEQMGKIGDVQLSGFSINSNESKEIIFTNILMGASSFRRKIFNEFEYNKQFPGWSYDDTEFSYRVGRKYKLVRNPRAKMYHHHSRSARDSNLKNMTKRVWMHYVLWKNCIPLSVKSLFCFLWSNFGYLIWIIVCYYRFNRIIGWCLGQIIIVKLICIDILKYFKNKLRLRNKIFIV